MSRKFYVVIEDSLDALSDEKGEYEIEICPDYQEFCDSEEEAIDSFYQNSSEEETGVLYEVIFNPVKRSPSRNWIKISK